MVHDANGTMPYCSPEVLMNEPYNQKTDVWALGCILFEMLARRRAFNDAQEVLLRDKILSCENPSLP